MIIFIQAWQLLQNFIQNNFNRYFISNLIQFDKDYQNLFLIFYNIK
nr:MAG TPA: hypothetical protein [Caudoviricetes sp.]